MRPQHLAFSLLFTLVSCGDKDDDTGLATDGGSTDDGGAAADGGSTTDGGSSSDGGTTGEPELDLDATSLVFDPVGIGCSSEAELLLSNVGDADLAVTALEVDDTAFSVDSDTLPGTVAPGASATIHVVLTGSTVGTLTAGLQITSDDSDEGEHTVPLSGEVLAMEAREERFTQSDLDALDLLVVTDDSGSSQDVQELFGEHYGRVPEALIEWGIDYHLGVITTSYDGAEEPGALTSEPITPDTADPVAAFEAAMDVGSTGAGVEEGFLTIEEALSEPLVSTTNAGFRRPEVPLAVFVLSDEDDSSEASPGDLASFLEGLGDEVRLDALVGDAPSKASPGGGCILYTSEGSLEASAGTRWIEAAELTGGGFRSVCSSNLAASLDWAVASASSLDTAWVLAEEPWSWAAVEVEVDGVAVALDLTSTDGWNWDEDGNSISLFGSAFPGPGQEVLVRYEVDASCE